MDSAAYINSSVEHARSPRDAAGYMAPVDGRSVRSAGRDRFPSLSSSGPPTRASDARHVLLEEEPEVYLEGNSSPLQADSPPMRDGAGRRSHLYEVLPSTSYGNGPYDYERADSMNVPGTRHSESSQQPLLHDSWQRSTSPATSYGVAARTSGASQQQNGYRKRVNPLYSSQPKLGPAGPQTGSSRCVTALSILALVLALTACTASLVSLRAASIYAAPLVGTNRTSVYDVLMRLDALESLVKQLPVAIQQNFSQTASTAADLSQLVKDVSRRLHTLQTNVSYWLADVRKMPGPPGPPGAGNLSQCAYNVKTAGGPAAEGSRSTIWIPASPDEAQSVVITGVVCSTEGGTHAFLRTDIDPVSSASGVLGYRRYRCMCTGAWEGSSSRYCHVHYWTCPRVS